MNIVAKPAMSASDMPSIELSRKTSKAGSWAIGGKLVGKVIDLGTFVVLTSYLTPHDLGLVAIAMTAIFIVEAVLDLPVAAALIRVKDPSEELFQTALTLGLMRGIAIGMSLAILAYPIAYFYREPQLVSVVFVLALAPALRGVTSPKMIIFARNFDFTKDFAIDICAKSAAFVVALVLASSFASYWAIAAATVTTPLVMVILSYVIAPMRPRLTLKEWPSLSNTIGWNSLAQIVSAMNWQLDRILLPRFISVADFGRFAVATDLAAVPHQTLSQPLVRPLIAAFASVEPGEPMKLLFERVAGVYFLLVAPVFLAVGIVATPVIETVLGPEWIAAAEILTWLAFTAIIALPANLLLPLSMRLDLSRFIALRTILELAIRLPVMVIGIWLYGIEGALVAQTVTALAVLCVTAWSVNKMIGLTIFRFAAALLRPGISAILCVFASLHIQNSIGGTSGSIMDDLQYAFAATSILIGYLAIIGVLWLLAGRPDGAERSILKILRRRAAHA